MSSVPEPLLELATRILAVLDRGSFVATYKYAVLLGLLDLCLERSLEDGAPPDTLTTRQLAAKVLELYWPQVREFPQKGEVLRQKSGNQAAILSSILEFQRAVADPGCSLWKAERQSGTEFHRLLDDVEWTLIEMPLPRLQIIGRQHIPFLYDIGWDDKISDNRGSVRRYQRQQSSNFDNRIHFHPGVAASLIALNGLLRPFIHREWCVLVARLNDLPETQLSDFLFGVDRTAFPNQLRHDLLTFQDRACFYCRKPLLTRSHVDHFIPWTRFPTNAIENLVIAHASCNGNKRDYLAASEHLRRWWERCRPESTTVKTLRALAESNGWPSRLEETRSICRALYRGTPTKMPLWRAAEEFVSAEEGELARAMA